METPKVKDKLLLVATHGSLPTAAASAAYFSGWGFAGTAVTVVGTAVAMAFWSGLRPHIVQLGDAVGLSVVRLAKRVLRQTDGVAAHPNVSSTKEAS